MKDEKLSWIKLNVQIPDVVNTLETKEEKLKFLKTVELDPLKYFVPNIVQEQMIMETAKASRESEIATILFTSGNGVGKTSIVINMVANLIYKTGNAYFLDEFYQKYNKAKHIVLMTTPTNIERNYFSTESDAPSFYRYFRNKDISYEKRGKNYVSHALFKDTGWELSVISYNQPITEMESYTASIFILDEPCPQILFSRIAGRMRKGGVIFMPMTPLDCDPYVKEEVIDKAENNVKGYRHVECSALDVLTDKPRGHYDKAIFLAQAEKYTSDEYEARVHGKLMYYKERILYNLKDDLHKVKPEEYPLKENYLYFHVFDPHDGKPVAEIWGAYTDTGRRIIFYETPIAQNDGFFWDMKGGISPKDHIKRTVMIERKLSQELGFDLNPIRIVDRHFAKQTRGGMKTNLWEDYEKAVEDLKEEGYTNLIFDLEPSYHTESGVLEVDYGIKRLNEALMTLPDGKPGFVIWNTCFHAWNGATHFVRKRPKTESELMKPPTSRSIIEKFKDFADTFRHFCCYDVSGYMEDDGIEEYDWSEMVGNEIKKLF